MQENKIPPTHELRRPEPVHRVRQGAPAGSPEATDWPRYSGHGVAGVSGFGFGGTNAHVVGQGIRARDRRIGNAGRAPPHRGADRRRRRDGNHPRRSPEAILPSRRRSPSSANCRCRCCSPSALLPSRRKRAAADLADWLETEGAARRRSPTSAARWPSATTAVRAPWCSRTPTPRPITGLRAIAAGKPGAGCVHRRRPGRAGRRCGCCPVSVRSTARWPSSSTMENAVFRQPSTRSTS